MLILAILIYGVRAKEVLIFVFIELKTVKKRNVGQSCSKVDTRRGT